MREKEKDLKTQGEKLKHQEDRTTPPMTLEEWKDRAVKLSVLMVEREKRDATILRILYHEIEENRKLKKELSIQVCISIVAFFLGISIGIFCCNISDKKELSYGLEKAGEYVDSSKKETKSEEDSKRKETFVAESVSLHSNEAVR